MLPPDPSIGYYCYYDDLGYKAKNWSHLMKLVLMVNKNPGAMPLIKQLLKNSDEVNKRNEMYWTPLMLACRHSNTCSNNIVVKMLINARADVNMGWSPSMFASSIYSHNGPNVEHCFLDWETPLIIASQVSNTDSNIGTVKMLINAGSDVDAIGDQGNTALICASGNSSMNSNIETVKMLINSGADINIKNYEGLDALSYAILHTNSTSNIDTVKILIDSGADLNSKINEDGTSLTYASKYCSSFRNPSYYYNVNIEIVKILLESKADPNIKGDRNMTALIGACSNPTNSINNDVINMLIDAGADVNCKNMRNQTPLMLSLINGTTDYDIIIKLIHHSHLTLLDRDSSAKSSFGYYVDHKYNFLDEYHLKMLSGDTYCGFTKSARG